MKTLLNNLLTKIKGKYHLRDYRFSLVLLVLIISIIGIFVVGSAQIPAIQDLIYIAASKTSAPNYNL